MAQTVGEGSGRMPGVKTGRSKSSGYSGVGGNAYAGPKIGGNANAGVPVYYNEYPDKNKNRHTKP